MIMQPRALWTRSRNTLKTAGLITAGLISLYMGWIQLGQRQREMNWIASSRGSFTEPLLLWRHRSFLAQPTQAGYAQPTRAALYQEGVVGGVPGSIVADKVVATLAPSSAEAAEPLSDRKLVRTASTSLVVKSPAQSAEKIIRLAQDAGGYLVGSQVNGGADALSASLTVRVPVAKFDEVRRQIRELGLRIDSEGVESQDVTRQYVDEQARLRNLRAQEEQYLGLLHRAATVKDTLEVSDKLNEIRGEIEEKQAEFETLSKQAETVAFNITLHAEADAQVFGLQWRPLYQLKMAAREGLDGFGDYAASMTLFAFYLPTILLWLVTILAGAAIGWRILKWAARILFRSRKAAVQEGPAVS